MEYKYLCGALCLIGICATIIAPLMLLVGAYEQRINRAIQEIYPDKDDKE